MIPRPVGGGGVMAEEEEARPWPPVAVEVRDRREVGVLMPAPPPVSKPSPTSPNPRLSWNMRSGEEGERGGRSHPDEGQERHQGYYWKTGEELVEVGSAVRCRPAYSSAAHHPRPARWPRLEDMPMLIPCLYIYVHIRLRDCLSL